MQKAFPASVPGAAWPYPEKRADRQQELVKRKDPGKVLGARESGGGSVTGRYPLLKKPQISFCLQT